MACMGSQNFISRLQDCFGTAVWADYGISFHLFHLQSNGDIQARHFLVRLKIEKMPQYFENILLLSISSVCDWLIYRLEDEIRPFWLKIFRIAGVIGNCAQLPGIKIIVNFLRTRRKCCNFRYLLYLLLLGSTQS